MDSFLGSIVKIGGKIGLNMVCPGVGSIVDFTEAAYCLYNKNYFDATLNVASGIFDLATAGVLNGLKGAAKEASKTAAVKEAYKQVVNETTEKFVKEGTKEKVATVAFKQLKKHAGKTLGKELGNNMIENTVEKVIYDLTKNPTDALLMEMLDKAYIYGVFPNYIQNLTLDTLEDVLYENLIKKAPKQLFTSPTARAAEKAAKNILEGPFQRIANVTKLKAWVIFILGNKQDQSKD